MRALLEHYTAFVNAHLGQSQRPLHILAWMSMLEVAETANEIKRIQTKDGGTLTEERRNKILEEMGDEFYYYTARLNYLGFTLEDVIGANIVKLEDRNGRKPIHFNADFAGYSPVPDMPSAH